MIEGIYLEDENGRKIVGIGRLKNTNVYWAIYFGGEIVMWAEEDE